MYQYRSILNMELKKNQTLHAFGILTEYRPWGKYEVLLDNEDVKVKRITVNPNSRLSYQYHEKRREQWIVISGSLTIVLDDEKVFRGPGESIHIPLGAKHRAWNETNDPVVFIETQTGTYFGEDDIIRLEDDYKRIN
jgi:mannose-6-phosphate isomerase